jgi:DHA2 family methylenomycin A resistance protein-like MFS transporter
MCLSNFIFYTLLFGVPIYLVEVRGIGDQIASLLLVGISIGAFISSPLGGMLSDLYGRRFPVVLGSILMLIGCTVLAIILKAPVIVLLVPFVCIGLGLGQAATARFAAALESWPSDVAGSASGTFIMFRYLGSIVGLAVMASVLGEVPSSSTFQILFVVLSCLGVVHLVTGVVMKPGKVKTNSLNT